MLVPSSTDIKLNGRHLNGASSGIGITVGRLRLGWNVDDLDRGILWLMGVTLSDTSDRIRDRPYVDHGTEGHNSFRDNVGPNLGGVSGDGDPRSGPGSLGENRPYFIEVLNTTI